MDEKPWHAIAREYLGWLNFLTWPYRGYQWIKYFLDRKPQERLQPEPTPPPLLQAKKPDKVWDGQRWVRPNTPKHKPGATIKHVEYHPFLGSSLICASLLGLGAFIIAVNIAGYVSTPHAVDQVKFTLSGITIGVLFVFFGLRYWITNSRKITYLTAPPAPRGPQDPPPTQEETQRARNHLRLAIVFAREAQDQTHVFTTMSVLNDASMELAKARSLDPSVTAPDPESDFTYTQDYLASELLFAEANALSAERDEASLQRARKAIERALLYLPNSVLYMRLAIDIYEKEGAVWAAKEMLKKALAIAHDDIELLKRHRRFYA